MEEKYKEAVSEVSRRSGGASLTSIDKPEINRFAKAGLETSREEDGRRRAETGFHALRHTFVSMALDAGMSPMLVRRLVWHSTSSMTDRYYHADPKKARELVEKMPGWD